MKRHWGGGAGGGARPSDSLEMEWPMDESIDRLYRKLIDTDDETSLALPPLGAEPHLLSSQVRKYYFETVIRLLSLNYEHSQRLPGKNIRLPGAIWRCAKRIEAQAVQACMLMQLYRENILIAVKQMKADTANGKLFRKLFESLNSPSLNDKSVQVNIELQTHNGEPVLKKRRSSHTKRIYGKDLENAVISNLKSYETTPDEIVPKNNVQIQNQNDLQYRIPVVVNVKCQSPCPIAQQHSPLTTNINTQTYYSNMQPTNTSIRLINTNIQPNNTNVQLTNTSIKPTNTNIQQSNNIQPTSAYIQPNNANIQLTNNSIQPSNTYIHHTNPDIQITNNSMQPTNTYIHHTNTNIQLTNSNGPFNTNVNQSNVDCVKYIENPQIKNVQNEPNLRLSVESQESEDTVMLQMEQLFRNDDEDDIFEGTFCGNLDYLTQTCDVIDSKEVQPQNMEMPNSISRPCENSLNSLDERIALLNSVGVLAPIAPVVSVVQKESPRPKRLTVSKWLCEDYYRRLFFYEKFDEICENNRKKYQRLLKKFTTLFNDEGEELQALSPQDETPDIILSCKERIGPLVVKNLMPYYSKGRIKSRALFKDVAKHIIKGLIECNRFPDEYEVFTYITDYFKVRPHIRCEADYRF